jgi:hypothetical protein
MLSHTAAEDSRKRTAFAATPRRLPASHYAILPLMPQ